MRYRVVENRPRPIDLIVLPHWGTGGGAGFYITALLRELKGVASITIGGPYAEQYVQSGKTVLPDQALYLLSKIHLIAYVGTRLRTTVYHLCISIVRVMRLLLLNRKRHIESTETAILFTSSIQALAVPFTKLVRPQASTILCVQENIDLTKKLGRPLLFLLRKCDLIIAITDSWAEHAREHGLDVFVYRNTYDPVYVNYVEAGANPENSDILYVGGGAAIKGFAEFCKFLTLAFSNGDFKVVCLGKYDAAAMSQLIRIKNKLNSPSNLVIRGEVPDIRPYMLGSKVLLLPIAAPHFCRPAIEAGFFDRTFVIPRFVGLEDFVHDGINCLTYEPGNVRGLLETISTLLSDDSLRASLEAGNSVLCKKYLRTTSNISALQAAICATLHPERQLE